MYTIIGKFEEIEPYVTWNYGENVPAMAWIKETNKNFRLPSGFCCFGRTNTKKELAGTLDKMKACYQAKKAIESGKVAPVECFLRIEVLQHEF